MSQHDEQMSPRESRGNEMGIERKEEKISQFRLIVPSLGKVIKRDDNFGPLKAYH